jgi:hypothetical protein
MFTYVSYKPQIYFKDFFVYIEMTVHIGIFLYSYLLDDHTDELYSRITAFFLLVFIYYRGLLFLQIFDAFTTLIGIINTIIKELLSFFFVLFYAYVMIVVLVNKLDKSNDVYVKFRDTYYWAILGGVDDDAFEGKEEIFLAAVLIGSLFVTIILLNILIAYLSNLFSRLEDQQRVSDLKQKALLVLDFETMIRFMKYRTSGIIHLERRLEDVRYQEMMQGITIPLDTVRML